MDSITNINLGIQRIQAVLARRSEIEQVGTEEHEMYIPFERFTLYLGEGSCGFIPNNCLTILQVGTCYDNLFPVPKDLEGTPDVEGVTYQDYYSEGLNMYDTSAYGQARWLYLEQCLKVLQQYV